MRGWSLSLKLSNNPGELAKLAKGLGEAGINIEGFDAGAWQTDAWVKVLVTDRDAAQQVIGKLGYTVDNASEVVVETLPNKPGTLGEVAQRIADAGVNLTTAYMATDTRVALGAENLDALEAAWRTYAGAATH